MTIQWKAQTVMHLFINTLCAKGRFTQQVEEVFFGRVDVYLPWLANNTMGNNCSENAVA